MKRGIGSSRAIRGTVRIETIASHWRRRDGRVAEGARLESVFTRKGNVGSNPTLSASSFNLLYFPATHTTIHTKKFGLRRKYGHFIASQDSKDQPQQVRKHWRRSVAVLPCSRQREWADQAGPRHCCRQARASS